MRHAKALSHRGTSHKPEKKRETRLRHFSTYVTTPESIHLGQQSFFTLKNGAPVMREDSICSNRSVHVCQCAASLLIFVIIAALGVISAPAVAGPFVPFSASGTILTIDTGDAIPAGQSGRFIVRDRHITGSLTGSLGGTTGVPFTITYDSNVPIATQSGAHPCAPHRRCV